MPRRLKVLRKKKLYYIINLNGVSRTIIALIYIYNKKIRMNKKNYIRNRMLFLYIKQINKT